MKKDRRRLVLNGNDDAYAQREAAKDSGDAAEQEAGAHRQPVRAGASPKPEPAARPEREPVPVPVPVLRKEWPSDQGSIGTAPVALKSVQAIQLNYRLNLGQDLSERLQRLADAHDQPIELMMKGLRARAAERFKILASGPTKPVIPEPETGGKSIRYATSISGDMATNLNTWFDPFGLGVAKDACKPLLIGLFQEEARVLCDTAEGVKKDPE